ncbi:hypothetical protein EG329_011663 [Mollisiaceae sp. DMI_Dod_QoI]|nr:hypothetical protein EG329_011663 [Helotiales sp. DMI_Dod_QoI]
MKLPPSLCIGPLLAAFLIRNIAAVDSQHEIPSSRRPSSQRRDADTKKGPNVLFIMSDDQDLHLNSMDYMPNVKSLIANHGTTYQKHFCTNALCCPSRISLLTGKAVHNTNVTDVAIPWGGYPKFITQGLNNDYLPIWLQEGGVNTYYVGKFSNGHNTKNYNKPFAKGWNNSDFLLEPGQYDYLHNIWTINKGDPQPFPGVNAIHLMTNQSLRMLDEAATAGGPFFLTVAPAIPHLGLSATNKSTFWPIPKPEYADAFSNATVPNTTNFNPSNATGASWIKRLERQDQTVVDLENGYYRARLRAIAGLDDLVSDLIARLEKHGILNNTYVFYTTDNGYHIGQHRMGPGKKCGYETDINIPMVIRGPGIPVNKNTSIVTTHTDLAPTFLSMFNIPLRTGFDGKPIPITNASITANSNRPFEHVNVEIWGSASLSEGINITEPKDLGAENNTYKSMRVIGSGYSLYYSVWCTNEHELYDMTNDDQQVNNLLSDSKEGMWKNLNQLQGSLLGHPLSKVMPRLDALLLVLKSCKESACTDPWRQLHPQGNVNSLADALNSTYDDFYNAQPKVRFTDCKPVYLIEYEGPQTAMRYNGS